MKIRASTNYINNKPFVLVMLPFDLFSDEDRVHVALLQLHALFLEKPCLVLSMNPEDKKIHIFGSTKLTEKLKTIDLSTTKWNNYQIDDESFKAMKFPTIDEVDQIAEDFLEALKKK